MTGERLKELRRKRGWSQLKLGEKVGVHYRTVSRWERGDEISRRYRARISVIFDLDVDTAFEIKREDRTEQRKRNKELLKRLNLKYKEMRDWDLDDPLVIEYRKGVGAI